MTNVSDSEQEGQMMSDAPDDPEDTPKSDSADSDDEILVKSNANVKLKCNNNTTQQQLTVNKMLQLPISRIRTIMKSSPELANVKPESYVLITRATELFVTYLAKRAHEMSPGVKTIEYNALSNVVAKDECLDFLEEIVPFKIKMKEYWEKYGYPVAEDDVVEIVEIESNGSSTASSSNGHTSASADTLKTPNANIMSSNTSVKTPKSTNSLNTSSQKTPKSGGKSASNKTIKTQKTINSSLKTPKSGGKVTPINGTPVNGTPVTPRIPGKVASKVPEVICIDD